MSETCDDLSNGLCGKPAAGFFLRVSSSRLMVRCREHARHVTRVKADAQGLRLGVREISREEWVVRCVLGS